VAIGSGLCSSIGYAREVTAGTYAVPSRHIEHVKEALKFEPKTVVSKGIRGCREMMPAPVQVGGSVKGSVSHELAPQATGLLFEHLFGAVATTGAAAPYTHVFTVGEKVEETLTVQVAKPSTNGVANPFTYVGMQVVGATIGAKAGEIVQSDWEFAGANELSSVSTPAGPVLAPLNYAGLYVPFTFVDGSVSVAGSAYEVDDLSLSFKNALRTDHFTMRAGAPGTPDVARRNGQRDYGGSLSSDFFDMVAYGLFRNGTHAALSVVFDAGPAAKLTIEGDVLFAGTSPTVDGIDILKQSLPFRWLSVTATLVNGDSAP